MSTTSSALLGGGYPTPIEALSLASKADVYKNVPENNPTVSGVPLIVLSRVVQTIGPISKFFWHNAHFGSLKGLKNLDFYSTRYEPTVIPAPSQQFLSASDDIPALFSNTDLVFYSSADYVMAYSSKHTTPTAVSEYLLSLIRSPPHSLAFIEINDELTLAAAKAATERYASGTVLGPLDGVPFAVKDEVDVKGYRRTLGSAKVFSGVECETAWTVRKLEEAGAVLIGKTNMHEMGTDTTNNNPVKGTPRNPYNQGYYTGGSSGGSAYAVGAGIVPIAVGADGGGSIRVPANYCGVYGIKPSQGRISGRPTPSLAPSNGVLGPIAATLDDLALSYRLMSAPDSLERASQAFPPPSPASSPLSPSPRGQKVLGIFKPWFNDCSPVVRALCQAAVDGLAQNCGYEVVDIDLPYLTEGRVAHALSIITEMHAAMGGDFTGLNAANRILLSVARHTPARDFIAAAKVRSLIMSHLAFLYQKYPGLVIVTPTTPMVGVKINKEGDLTYGVSDTNTSIRSMRYVFLANFSGCPAVVSGVGYDDASPTSGVKGGGSGSGLMVSLMGMSEWGREEELFGWAKEVAKVSGMAEGRRKGEVWVDVLGAVGARRGAA